MKLSNNVRNEFLEWLNDCPYLWHLDSSEDSHLTYTFIIEKEVEYDDTDICSECLEHCDVWEDKE